MSARTHAGFATACAVEIGLDDDLSGRAGSAARSDTFAIDPFIAGGQAGARADRLVADSSCAREAGAQWLVPALLQSVDAAWLIAFRVLFGLVLGVSMLRFVVYGWVDRFFVSSAFHFKYWGFAWVEPLSGPAMHGLFWALAGLSLAVAAGAAFRVSAVLFALGLSYVQLIDVTTYLNHYYLAALLAWLLAFSPAGRVGSVDAGLRARWRRRPLQAASVPAGVLFLFRFQVGLVYVFAALAKLQSDWLLHGQTLRIWLGAKVDLPWIGPLFTLPWVPLTLSWVGFLFDATIVGWLLVRRTRPWAFAGVIGFHALTRLLFPIGMFPVIMITSALVFFAPSWPRTLLRFRGPRVLESSGPAALSRGARWAIACGLVYGFVQLVLPLRWLAYGGDVLWHEQGMRFSWRVMVRAKGGNTTFVVRDRASGRTVYVSPREYLTDLQESEMSGQPDLILQLAHHVHDDYARRGFRDPEVRVEARASLNGRRSAVLVDPRVDLASISDGLAPASWITPAPRNAPPHTRPVL